jgi:hypothetical protein
MYSSQSRTVEEVPLDVDEQILTRHLQGAHLNRIEKREGDWLFLFDTGCSIAIESLWRLVAKEAIHVTSEDHGHRFGLPAPVNAAAVAIGSVAGGKIRTIHVHETTSDLTLNFDNGVSLQFISTSAGFESWIFGWADTQVIGRNGDRVIWKREDGDKSSKP